jgi:hypothetical protein
MWEEDENHGGPKTGGLRIMGCSDIEPILG